MGYDVIGNKQGQGEMMRHDMTRRWSFSNNSKHWSVLFLSYHINGASMENEWIEMSRMDLSPGKNQNIQLSTTQHSVCKVMWFDR